MDSVKLEQTTLIGLTHESRRKHSPSMQHAKSHAAVITWFQQNIIRCYCFYYDVPTTSPGLNSAALCDTQLAFPHAVRGPAGQRGWLPLQAPCPQPGAATSCPPPSPGELSWSACVCTQVGGRKPNQIRGNWWRRKASVVPVLGSNLRNSRLVRVPCSLPHPHRPVTLILKIPYFVTP